jgi:hypothetical protein
MSKNIYCTYLTIYRGNKLPPFYIGSSSVENINKGYHGSVCSRKYKQTWTDEIRNNPHLFTTKIVTTHSSRKEATDKERIFQKQLNVVCSSMYINQSIAAPNGYYGNPEKKTDLTRKKMSTNNSRYWTKKTFSEEHKENLRKSGLGRKCSQQTKNKKSSSMKLFYSNNPTFNKGENNPMFGKTFSDESKKKIGINSGAARKGKKRGPYKKKIIS